MCYYSGQLGCYSQSKEKGLPPAVIRNEQRRFYLDALAKADKGDLGSIVLFIGQSFVNTQKQSIGFFRAIKYIWFKHADFGSDFSGYSKYV